MSVPDVLLVFSGKRKSGKDFVTDILLERLGHDMCTILRLSGPLKKQYAVEHELDYDKLLDASSYKEQHRASMIRWGEEQRKRDPWYFCRLAVDSSGPDHRVWMVSDARRQTDVQFFREKYPEQTVTLRVTADESVRSARGFVFTKGIDDAESECGLDSGVSWDFLISNNGDQESLESQLAQLLSHVRGRLT